MHFTFKSLLSIDVYTNILPIPYAQTVVSLAEAPSNAGVVRSDLSE